MEIAAGRFKTHCLGLMEEVRKHHQTIVITKRGRPVAKLVPCGDEAPEAVFGFLKGHASIAGDIVAPTGERWNADAEG
jgi:prevent-host-death family protein